MADWSIAQMPNFAQAALSGYQAGAAIGKQKQLDQALGNVDLERPETLYPVLRADPTTGAALLGTSMKMAEYKHELAAKAATSDYLISRLGLDSSASSSSGGSTSPSPAPVAPQAGAAAVNGAADSAISPAQPGEITVTAHANPEAARVAMIRNDPDQYIKLETSLAGMDEAKQKAVQGQMGTFDAALQGVKGLPYAQRSAYLATHRDALIQAGIPAQQIDSFDPTDENITAIDNQVLGIKGILDRQDKDRNFQLDQAKFGETQRHNQVDEGQGQQRIGLEGANVAIARGHLALDQQKASGAGNGSGVITRQLSNGQTAYRNPLNGKWYDNPGFK
jgi:hypothetical protein